MDYLISTQWELYFMLILESIVKYNKDNNKGLLFNDDIIIYPSIF